MCIFIPSAVIINYQFLLCFFPPQFILTHSDGKKFREVLESNPTKLLNIGQQQVIKVGIIMQDHFFTTFRPLLFHSISFFCKYGCNIHVFISKYILILLTFKGLLIIRLARFCLYHMLSFNLASCKSLEFRLKSYGNAEERIYECYMHV